MKKIDTKKICFGIPRYIITLFLLGILVLSNLSAEEQKKPAFDITTRNYNVPLKDKEEFVKWRLSITPETRKMVEWRWDTAKLGITYNDFTNQRVMEAFLCTPREFFCEAANQNRAYEDNWLVIKHGVTISGPHIVAKMTDEINPAPNHKVLEIGTGSGYQSAFLSQLTNWVYTIEIIEPRAKDTDATYKSLEKDYPEYKNIHRKIGDGYYGWEEEAPFDRIIVTCGIDHIPPALLQQLKPDGIIVIPVGSPGSQTLLKVTKKVDADGKVTLIREDVYKGRHKVVFIPFTSDGGKGRHNKVVDNIKE